MAPMDTKTVQAVLNQEDQPGAIGIAMYTRDPPRPESGPWTSNRPRPDSLAERFSAECLKTMVGSRRLELPTSSVSRKRSNQLSYEPTNRREITV